MNAAPFLNAVVAVVGVESHALAPPRFLAPTADAAEPPVRVVEYIRHSHLGCNDAGMSSGCSGMRWLGSTPARPPNWPAWFLLVLALVTLASVVDGCHPSPGSAWASSPEGSR